MRIIRNTETWELRSWFMILFQSRNVTLRKNKRQHGIFIKGISKQSGIDIIIFILENLFWVSKQLFLSFCFVTRSISHIDVTYISTQYRKILFYNDQYSEEISSFVSIKPKNGFFNNCLCSLQLIFFFFAQRFIFPSVFSTYGCSYDRNRSSRYKIKLIKHLRLTCSNITQNTI